MIYSSYDLLMYIRDHNGNLRLTPDLGKELGISIDDLESFVSDLESCGYIRRHIRSYSITPAGQTFLKNN
ncbi:MAG: hypothetical protein Q4C97_03890 [Bacillota bacterium]|nr:hypothetical protein [Bacillota bacterium]